MEQSKIPFSDKSGLNPFEFIEQTLYHSTLIGPYRPEEWDSMKLVSFMPSNLWFYYVVHHLSTQHPTFHENREYIDTLKDFDQVYQFTDCVQSYPALVIDADDQIEVPLDIYKMLVCENRKRSLKVDIEQDGSFRVVFYSRKQNYILQCGAKVLYYLVQEEYPLDDPDLLRKMDSLACEMDMKRIAMLEEQYERTKRFSNLGRSTVTMRITRQRIEDFIVLVKTAAYVAKTASDYRGPQVFYLPEFNAFFSQFGLAKFAEAYYQLTDLTIKNPTPSDTLSEKQVTKSEPTKEQKEQTYESVIREMDEKVLIDWDICKFIIIPEFQDLIDKWEQVSENNSLNMDDADSADEVGSEYGIANFIEKFPQYLVDFRKYQCYFPAPDVILLGLPFLDKDDDTVRKPYSNPVIETYMAKQKYNQVRPIKNEKILYGNQRGLIKKFKTFYKNEFDVDLELREEGWSNALFYDAINKTSVLYRFRTDDPLTDLFNYCRLSSLADICLPANPLRFFEYTFHDCMREYTVDGWTFDAIQKEFILSKTLRYLVSLRNNHSMNIDVIWEEILNNGNFNARFYTPKLYYKRIIALWLEVDSVFDKLSPSDLNAYAGYRSGKFYEEDLKKNNGLRTDLHDIMEMYTKYESYPDHFDEFVVDFASRKSQKSIRTLEEFEALLPEDGEDSDDLYDECFLEDSEQESLGVFLTTRETESSRESLSVLPVRRRDEKFWWEEIIRMTHNQLSPPFTQLEPHVQLTVFKKSFFILNEPAILIGDEDKRSFSDFLSHIVDFGVFFKNSITRSNSLNDLFYLCIDPKIILGKIYHVIVAEKKSGSFMENFEFRMEAFRSSTLTLQALLMYYSNVENEDRILYYNFLDSDRSFLRGAFERMRERLVTLEKNEKDKTKIPAARYQALLDLSLMYYLPMYRIYELYGETYGSQIIGDIKNYIQQSINAKSPNLGSGSREREHILDWKSPDKPYRIDFLDLPSSLRKIDVASERFSAVVHTPEEIKKGDNRLTTEQLKIYEGLLECSGSLSHKIEKVLENHSDTIRRLYILIQKLLHDERPSEKEESEAEESRRKDSKKIKSTVISPDEKYNEKFYENMIQSIHDYIQSERSIKGKSKLKGVESISESDLQHINIEKLKTPMISEKKVQFKFNEFLNLFSEYHYLIKYFHGEALPAIPNLRILESGQPLDSLKQVIYLYFLYMEIQHVKNQYLSLPAKLSFKLFYNKFASELYKKVRKGDISDFAIDYDDGNISEQKLVDYFNFLTENAKSKKKAKKSEIKERAKKVLGSDEISGMDDPNTIKQFLLEKRIYGLSDDEREELIRLSEQEKLTEKEKKTLATSINKNLKLPDEHLTPDQLAKIKRFGSVRKVLEPLRRKIFLFLYFELPIHKIPFTQCFSSALNKTPLTIKYPTKTIGGHSKMQMILPEEFTGITNLYPSWKDGTPKNSDKKDGQFTYLTVRRLFKKQLSARVKGAMRVVNLTAQWDPKSKVKPELYDLMETKSIVIEAGETKRNREKSSEDRNNLINIIMALLKTDLKEFSTWLSFADISGSLVNDIKTKVLKKKKSGLANYTSIRNFTRAVRNSCDAESKDEMEKGAKKSPIASEFNRIKCRKRMNGLLNLRNKGSAEPEQLTKERQAEIEQLIKDRKGSSEILGFLKQRMLVDYAVSESALGFLTPFIDQRTKDLLDKIPSNVMKVVSENMKQFGYPVVFDYQKNTNPPKSEKEPIKDSVDGGKKEPSSDQAEQKKWDDKMEDLFVAVLKFLIQYYEYDCYEYFSSPDSRESAGPLATAVSQAKKKHTSLLMMSKYQKLLDCHLAYMSFIKKPDGSMTEEGKDFLTNDGNRFTEYGLNIFKRIYHLLPSRAFYSNFDEYYNMYLTDSVLHAQKSFKTKKSNLSKVNKKINKLYSSAHTDFSECIFEIGSVISALTLYGKNTDKLVKEIQDYYNEREKQINAWKIPEKSDTLKELEKEVTKLKAEFESTTVKDEKKKLYKQLVEKENEKNEQKAQYAIEVLNDGFENIFKKSKFAIDKFEASEILALPDIVYAERKKEFVLEKTGGKKVEKVTYQKINPPITVSCEEGVFGKLKVMDDSNRILNYRSIESIDLRDFVEVNSSGKITKIKKHLIIELNQKPFTKIDAKKSKPRPDTILIDKYNKVLGAKFLPYEVDLRQTKPKDHPILTDQEVEKEKNRIGTKLTEIQKDLKELQNSIESLRKLEGKFISIREFLELDPADKTDEKVSDCIKSITAITGYTRGQKPLYTIWYPQKQISLGAESHTIEEVLHFSDEKLKTAVLDLHTQPLFLEFLEINISYIGRRFRPLSAQQLKLIAAEEATLRQQSRGPNRKHSDGYKEINKKIENFAKYGVGIYSRFYETAVQEKFTSMVKDEFASDKPIPPLRVVIHLSTRILKKVYESRTATLQSVQIILKETNNVCANVSIKCESKIGELREESEEEPNEGEDGQEAKNDVNGNDDLASITEEQIVSERARVLGVDQNQLRRLRTFAFAILNGEPDSINDVDFFSKQILSEEQMNEGLDIILPMMNLPLKVDGTELLKADKIRKALKRNLENLKRPTIEEPYNLTAEKYNPTYADLYMAPVAYWGKKRSDITEHIRLNQIAKSRYKAEKDKAQPESDEEKELLAHIRRLNRQIRQLHRKYERIREKDVPKYLENLIVYLVNENKIDVVAVESLHIKTDRVAGAVGRISAQMVGIDEIKGNVVKRLGRDPFIGVSPRNTSSDCAPCRINGVTPITKLDRRGSVDWAYCWKDNIIVDSHGYAATNIGLNYFKKKAKNDELEELLAEEEEPPP